MKNEKVIYLEDKEYPIELKRLKDPPKKIYTAGNINLLKNNVFRVAIVGTRRNTEYGKNMALNFSKKLSKKGVTIVSGLANGIDSYSHIGAIIEKGKTIAVLPCGLKNIYPKENKKLCRVIIDNGGLVITEYSQEIEADSSKFTERNRIVAGLSKGLLVVEGDYRSGTRNTAKIAKKLDLPVFCIPSNLDSKKGYAPNLLLKNGGYVVTNEFDIIEKIKNVKCIQKEIKTKFEYDIEEQFYKKFGKINEEKVDYKIYKYIGEKPIDVDGLMECAKMNIQDVNYEITMLTLEDKIIELPGKKYIKAKK